tara:strand:+ start:297 stop:509 length:213 start_codon:yes stop_codon:yes gene_type:complete
MENTIEDFIKKYQEDHGNDDSEEKIRKAIDRIAFWVSHIDSSEQFIVREYLQYLSHRFNFNIDTDIDSRN